MFWNLESRAGGFFITTFQHFCLVSCWHGEWRRGNTQDSNYEKWCCCNHSDRSFLWLFRPDGSQYRTFRNQFLAYSFYQSELRLFKIPTLLIFDKLKANVVNIHAPILLGFVQCLQCYYQSGCLYRLRSLGERHNLDLTVGEINCPNAHNKSTIRKLNIYSPMEKVPKSHHLVKFKMSCTIPMDR